MTAQSEPTTQFLGAWIDENLAWGDHIHPSKNKIAKNMEVLYQRKQYLAKPWSKQIYFADIHTYLNFENLA